MIPKIRIGKTTLFKNKNKVFIIAEAGVSHFGSFKKAKKLIDVAKKSGADAVKFQAYITEELIHENYKSWFKKIQNKEVDYNFFLNLNYMLKRKKLFYAPHTLKQQLLGSRN